MRRFLLIALVVLVVLTVLILGAGAWMINDEDFLKAQLGKQVYKYTGRELVISGPLQIDVGRETSIHAEDIVFSNADWADTPDMVRVGQLGVRIDIPSLFNSRKPAIPWIRISDCSIDLRENESGQKNWDVLPPSPTKHAAEPDEKPKMPVELGDLLIKDCRLRLETQRRTRPVHFFAQEISLNRGVNNRLTSFAEGTINEEEIRLDGWLEPASAFLEGGPVEHDLKIRFGAVSLQSAGVIADAHTLAGAEIEARFHGPSMQQLLEDLSLPPFSEGEFDFQLALDSSGGMTRLDIDGDLGSVFLKADGEVDRLAKPTTGSLVASLNGPNLQALGMALGTEGFPAVPYSLHSSARFSKSVITIEEADFQAGANRLQLSGVVNTSTNMPDSDLKIRLESSEVGQLLPLLGKLQQELGSLALEGSAFIDKAGILSIDASTDFQGSHVQARGPIGPITGPLQPRLSVEFSSQDPGPLLQLAGIDTFPAEPLHFVGDIQKEQERVEISGFELDFAGNRVEGAGILNLEEKHSGSEISLNVDIKNLAELGQLFGQQDLPPQPLAVSGTLKPEGEGLTFDISQSSLGEIGIKANGRIADLDKPLALDAEFDIGLPGLNVLSSIIPDKFLLPGALSASGSLHNEAQSTRLQDVQVKLGDVGMTVSGKLMHDKRFDLQIGIEGPDAAVFSDLVGQSLEAKPFSVATSLSGDPAALSLKNLTLELGESRATGDLEIGLGKPVQISGAIYAPRLDLRNWKTDDEEIDPPEEEPASKFVFDDTPAMRIDDYGVEIDASIKIDVLDLGNTQLDDIDLGILLQRHYLKLNPFTLNSRGGGRFSGDVVLDGRQTEPSLDINFHARQMKGGLGAGVGQDISTWPPSDIDIVLTGKGMTQREMASSLNGKIRVSYGEGLVASSGLSMLFSDFITEFFNTLNPFAKTNEYTRLECAVAAADITDGQVKVFPVIVNTDQVTILSQGAIDLTSERIDLSFNTNPRQGLGLSASALINPFIKLGGSMKKPVVEIDPTGTVVKGGLAVATMGISILAKSMSDRFLSSKDPCGDALKEIAERDATPP